MTHWHISSIPFVSPAFTDPTSAAHDIGGICPPTVWGSWIGSQFALFGGLCALQAYRLRFIVTKDGNFVIKNVSSDPGAGTYKKGGKAELEDWGENYVVGGKNSWNMKKIINYKFFPNEYYPVLVYFKEIQTPKVILFCLCYIFLSEKTEHPLLLFFF
jgi:hypothetical protein